MRKRRVHRSIITVLMMLLVTLILCSCSTNSNQEDFLPVGKEPSQELAELCAETYKTVTDYYDLEKEMPRVVILTEEEMEEVCLEYWGITSGESHLEAFYSYSNRTIYLKEGFQEKSIPDLAHEFIHYLSDNGEGYAGLEYAIGDTLAGVALNEGATEYLTRKIYPYPEDKEGQLYSYIFETNIVEQLELAYGEEKFEEAYFTSNLDSLREDFNDYTESAYGNGDFYDLEIDQFDSFNICLYICYCYSIYDDVVSQEEVTDRMSFLLEILWYYGESKGVREEMVNIFQDFQNEW